MATARRDRLLLAGVVFTVLFAQVALYPDIPALGLPYGAVLGLRFLQGAATIGAFSLAITTLMDLPGGHGRNMGAAGIAIGAGTALGAPVGGQLYGLGPFVPLYAASALLLVAGGLAALAGDRAPDTDRGGLASAFGVLRERPELVVPFAFGFVDRLTAGFFALVGTVYFRTVLELDAAGTGAMLGAFFAPFALLQYPFGRLSDRVGRVGPVAAGSLVYGVAIVCVFLAPSIPLTAVAMVLVGVFGALVAPATMALVTDLAGDARGVAMGGFNVFGSLGFLTGVVGGATVAASEGFGAAFLAVGLTEAAIAIVALPALLRLSAGRPAAERA